MSMFRASSPRKSMSISRWRIVPRKQFSKEIREKVTLLPGMNVSIGQPISHRIDHMLSGTRANIAVKIFGDDLPMLRALAKQVNEVMKDVPGVVDLSVEQQTDIPTLRVKVDQAAAARYGVRAGDVTEAIQTAFVGSEVGQVLEGQISFPAGRPRTRATSRRGSQRSRRPRSTRRPGRRFRCPRLPKFAKTAVRTSSCGKASSAASSCSAIWQAATFARS